MDCEEFFKAGRSLRRPMRCGGERQGRRFRQERKDRGENRAQKAPVIKSFHPACSEAKGARLRFKFPYLVYKGIRVPLVPLQLKGKEGWRWVWAFVDSGATYSIFHPDVAARLGVEMSSGRRVAATVGDGKTIGVFLHKMPVNFQGREFHATIGFSDGLKVGFNLLGREDIFRIFRVCFSDRHREVTFTEV